MEDETRVLHEAILQANAAVLREAEERDLYGMGTTLTALRLRDRTATLVHIGDTRACLVVDKELRPLTQDHTMIALMVEAGTLAPEQADLHPDRHLLTQAVGTQPTIEPEVVQTEIPRDTRVLLCSDGLHDVVPAAEIAELASQPDLEAAVEELIKRANDLGGPDNVSVILVQV